MQARLNCVIERSEKSPQIILISMEMSQCRSASST